MPSIMYAEHTNVFARTLWRNTSTFGRTSATNAQKMSDRNFRLCYHIAGNFRMCKVLHISNTHVVRKLERTKSFAQDDETTRLFLVRKLFVHYGTPNVPVNMVAPYYRLDGERSMYHVSKSSNLLNVCCRGRGLKGKEN